MTEIRSHFLPWLQYLWRRFNDDQCMPSAAALTSLGIDLLVITAVVMLRSIDSAFNTIWRSRKNRSPSASFLLYWAVLSLGELFDR